MKKLIAQANAEIRQNFCMVDDGGYLDSVINFILKDYEDAHISELYSVAHCLPLGEVYSPSTRFSMEKLIRDAFAVCISVDYAELLQARYVFMYSDLGKDIPAVWFEDASENDLLSAWDEWVHSKLFSLPYYVEDYRLTPSQQKQVEDILIRMENARNPEEVCREVDTNVKDWYLAEQEITEYIRNNQPEKFDLAEIYSAVVKDIVAEVISRNTDTLAKNRR